MQTERAMVKNAADPKQIKKARELSKAMEHKKEDDLKFILSSPHGRKFLWDLLGWCGLYASPENARGDETQRAIGRQNVARKILSDIVSADESSWILMQQENLKQGDFNV